ncbi:MAG: YceH family protein [Acidobacteriaceae bacterium]
MEYVLTAVEARVLGALVEKQITTPEYCPLSLNALVNACNQKTNREPVMELDEDTVREAVYGLEKLKLAGRARTSDGRVAKYEHWLGEVFNFRRDEEALICLLLLRGEQTLGELRGRGERMYKFVELADVQSALERLMARETPLVRALSRQPGTKEVRYAQLLSESTAITEAAAWAQEEARGAGAPREDRLERLEGEVATLRQEVARLREEFEKLTS